MRYQARLFTLICTGALLMSGCGGGGTSGTSSQTTALAATIAAQPLGQTVILGQPATFTVNAGGSPAPGYQWLKNGLPISGATSSSLRTAATVKADQNALFTVVVSNETGSVTSNGATLVVQWAPEVTAPSDQTVSVGGAATFSVTADAYPAPTVQWQRDGSNISGATSLSHTISPTLASDNGSAFLAVVSNGVGNAKSNSAKLTVIPRPTPASVVASPLDSAVMEGQSTRFTVVASGSAPLTYQWYKNQVAIAGATTDTLVLATVKLADAGSYNVAVDNEARSPVFSSSATLTVSAVSVAPNILSQTLDLSLVEGNQATFKVVANGTGPLAYQWQCNQVDLIGSSTDTLSLPTITLAQSGAKYRCRVSNVVKSIYSTESMLTVMPSPIPPVIINFAGSPAVIALGSTTSLGWAVTAARSLSVDNGVGDVSNLDTKVVRPDQVGVVTYTLSATNGAGTSTKTTSVTVNSGPSYQLTVNADASVTGQPATGNPSYVQGTIVSYAYVPATGYSNLQVTSDGSPVSGSGTLVMNGNHSLIAKAMPQSLTVLASAGAGGTISPSGAVAVPYGSASPKFTITPNPGYVIKDVLADGVSIGPVGICTLPNVTANRTLAASFVQVNTLTLNLGSGVTCNLTSGSYRVDQLLPYAFSVLNGYEPTSLVVTENGAPVPASSALDMMTPHTLTATASVMTYSMTKLVLSAAGSGTISGPDAVPFGQIPTFTFIPAAGYTLFQVLVDDVPVVLQQNAYTFPSPVAAAHTIKAFFTYLP